MFTYNGTDKTKMGSIWRVQGNYFIQNCKISNYKYTHIVAIMIIIWQKNWQKINILILHTILGSKIIVSNVQKLHMVKHNGNWIMI